MKQYLLAVQLDESTPETDEERKEQMARTAEVTAEMRSAGSWVFVGGLRPSHATTVVRPSGGATTMTDGPFAETKEQLGGFWVIQCDDLDQGAVLGREMCAGLRAPARGPPVRRRLGGMSADGSGQRLPGGVRPVRGHADARPR